MRSVVDLPRYKTLFHDPEEPAEGRFYNCPTGWTCEIVNSQKLKAYRLQNSYTNFRTGAGPVSDVAISAVFRHDELVLFYYWLPTSLMGRFKLVQLEESSFSEGAWATLSDPKNPGPIGSRSLSAKIIIGVSHDFHDKAPALIELFREVEIPLPLFNELLADMAQNHREVGGVCAQFLHQHREIWSHWVPTEVAARLDASLKQASPALMAHYLSGRQRILVRRPQDTFQARSEWPTWLLIARLHGGWALLASQYRHWGWPVLVGLVPFAFLCMSLQHELIHGRPTRWLRLSAVLGYLPLVVWYPYPLYRDSHLRHHLDEQLAHPGLDPESCHVSLSERPHLGSWRRRWLCPDKTLLGHAILGPLLALVAMARLEGSRLRQEEGVAQRLRGPHAVLPGGLLAGLWHWMGIPPWLYLPAVAYPTLGLNILRSFCEHRPVREPVQCSAPVETGWP